METKIKKKKPARRMRKWHKWVGVFFTFFIFMFAVSGIFLNHRRAISSIDIPRSVLGSEYSYDNWNNGSVKGGFKLSPDSILLYGGNSIWLTDSLHQSFTPFTKGIKEGADNNIFNNIQSTVSDKVFAVSTFDLYMLDQTANEWKNLSDMINTRERFTDVGIQNDSVILMTRSHLYVTVPPYSAFEKIEIPAPENYKKETSLFRTMWTLHSGELFGLPGKIIVDIMGVLTIVLCITGVILFFWPGVIRRKKKKEKETKRSISLFKGSLKWHNKLGVWFLAFFLIIAVSGMFLRPPLLIAIVKGKTKPIPGTMLDSDNPWHDKLRTIRFDQYTGEWMFYSSEGFFRTKTLHSIPEKIEKAPPVSVMGVTVLHQQDSIHWLAGSFSGLYVWNRATGESTDFYTGEVYVKKGGMPTFTDAISGYCDVFNDKEIVFRYKEGAVSTNSNKEFAVMPDAFKQSRMSLWHLCLEIHVGRIYTFLPGIIESMFVFISGVLFLIVLISGYVVYRRHYRKRKKKTVINEPQEQK